MHTAILLSVDAILTSQELRNLLTQQAWGLYGLLVLDSAAYVVNYDTAFKYYLHP